MKLLVVSPHFAPDTAPTGTVMTRLVEELAELGHEIHVVTALPWYRQHRVEQGWSRRWLQTECTSWGSITRVFPFPGTDKSNLVRRTAGFAGFSLLAGFALLRSGGWFRRVDVVLAMSPPLTLGLTGWFAGRLRRAPLVFNVQDVFPDAAVRTGAIRRGWIIACARWLERVTYRSATAVTVLSDGLADNVSAKVRSADVSKVHVIPNFVDTDAIRPGDRINQYRHQLGIEDETVVLYAGNVGFSQSIDVLIEAAKRRPALTFVVNGEGAARPGLEALVSTAGIGNVLFVDYQPAGRLCEVLAAGDIHVVPLRRGLGDVSVPSKTYSSLAAARPVVAAIDAGSEIPRLLSESGGGISVTPDDVESLLVAIDELVADPERRRQLGESGRDWAVAEASPAAVARRYAALLEAVSGGRADWRARPSKV